MALSSSGLPSLAAATIEMLPSVVRRAGAIRAAHSAISPTPTSRPPTNADAPLLAKPVLSELVRNATSCQSTPVSGLRRTPPAFNFQNTISGAMTSVLLGRRDLSSVSRPVLGAALPALRSMHTNHASRMHPLATPSSAFHLRQSRSFSSISRAALASFESTANAVPTSAAAQNNFYQALLRLNMPAIVVERYQCGRFARNEACDQAYQTALARVTGTASATPGYQPAASPSNQFAQVVAQSAVAQSQGAAAATTVGGSGTRIDPTHVVLSEPPSKLISQWLWFIIKWAIYTYFGFAFMQFLTEHLQSRPGGNGRGKGSSKEAKPEQQTARFAHVHGCEEAKEELQDVVEFLKNPGKFNALGGKLPKGVLLVGPPGTGKTLLARAIAGEAGVPFFYASGSEFDEVWVGLGARRMRDLFSNARNKSPAIIFIDELDAVGSRRSSLDQQWTKQTLNQLLTELDGFDQTSNVVIIAATNFPEKLDKALIRPGRFDRHVTVGLPDARGRIAILKHHAKKIKVGSDIKFDAIAARTSGLSGAELENIVNQAAIHAAKNKSKTVSHADFDWAKDKVIMGAERKSMVMSPKEKEMTAYHEAGHALICLYGADDHADLYKVTILPRGQTLGHTAFLPATDVYSQSRKNIKSAIDRAMGGKAAEELVYGSEMTTSGVSNDLDVATRTAWRMVGALGMSPKLGPFNYLREYERLSSETKASVESEVKRVLEESYSRAMNLLKEKRTELDRLAIALLDYETLDKDEVLKVIRGEKLPDRIAMPRGPMVVPRPPSPPDGGDGGVPGSPLPEQPGTTTQPPPPPPPPEVSVA